MTTAQIMDELQAGRAVFIEKIMFPGHFDALVMERDYWGPGEHAVMVEAVSCTFSRPGFQEPLCEWSPGVVAPTIDWYMESNRVVTRDTVQAAIPGWPLPA